MNPDDIERDIERTRAEVSLTLYALEQKLAARYLVQKGFDMFKDMLGRPDALNNGLNRSLEAVRANPLPVALIGIGAAWLIASNTGVVERLGFGGEGSGEAGDRALGHTGNPTVDQTSRQGSSNGWVHQVADIAQGALRSARDSSGAALNRAGTYAGGGAGRIADQIADAFQRHPMVIGAVGLMAGALLGAMLPTTAMEDEWVGGTRDELLHKAEQAGEQAISQVRDLAVKAADAAADAATDTVKTATDRIVNG